MRFFLRKKTLSAKKKKKNSTYELVLPPQTDVQHLNVTDVPTSPLRWSLLIKGGGGGGGGDAGGAVKKTKKTSDDLNLEADDFQSSPVALHYLGFSFTNRNYFVETIKVDNKRGKRAFFLSLSSNQPVQVNNRTARSISIPSLSPKVTRCCQAEQKCVPGAAREQQEAASSLNCGGSPSSRGSDSRLPVTAQGEITGSQAISVAVMATSAEYGGLRAKRGA